MPAPDFTVEITALVNANMTTGNGYSAADRTAAIAFLVSDIVPLVDPDSIIADYTDPINTAIAASVFANAFGAWQTMLLYLCSETINTIVVPAYAGSANLISKMLYSIISQVGVNPPTFNSPPNPNTMGEVPVWGYDSVGNYDLNFATTTPFLDAENVEVLFSNLGFRYHAYYTIIAPNQMVLEANTITANTVTGELVGTYTNGIFTDVQFRLTVFQAA